LTRYSRLAAHHIRLPRATDGIIATPATVRRNVTGPTECTSVAHRGTPVTAVALPSLRGDAGPG
jgi:hypothetical protein